MKIDDVRELDDEVGSCMRQHSKPSSLFDGVLGFVGSHRPYHCDRINFHIDFDDFL